MNLTVMFDQAVAIYRKNSIKNEKRWDGFILALHDLFVENGWEDVDDSKNYPELKAAAKRQGRKL